MCPAGHGWGCLRAVVVETERGTDSGTDLEIGPLGPADGLVLRTEGKGGSKSDL